MATPTQIADTNTDTQNGGWIVIIAGWMDAIVALELGRLHPQLGTPTSRNQQQTLEDWPQETKGQRLVQLTCV